MLRASVIGATGYKGMELVRILSGHPGVNIAHLVSQDAGDSGHETPCFDPHAVESVARDSDVVFLSLPPGHSMETAPKILETGASVIDLGVDFRLRKSSDFENWYGLPHSAPGLLEEAAYGLPELNRLGIGGARLVANPGSYPTAALLAAAPLLKAGLIDGSPVIVDAKSGVSCDEGSSPVVGFADVNENMVTYGAGGHQYLPEMVQEMAGLAAQPVRACFTHHLAPMTRGILTTAYVTMPGGISQGELEGLYDDFYSGEPFIGILPQGLPATKKVLGSNNCHIAVKFDPSSGIIIAMTAIDNLVKGAAGQAVQNMNILFGLSECAGLKGMAIFA